MEQSPNVPVSPESIPPQLIPPYKRINPSSPRWNLLSVILVAAAILVAIALIVPPIQLFARITWLSCTEVSAKSPTAVGPDGLTVELAGPKPATLRLKMSRLTQDNLPAAALKALPQNTTPLGPLYQLGVCGDNKSVARLSVPAAIDATNASQVDLIAWNGKSWQWIGSAPDVALGTLTAQLDTLPPSVMVVETSAPAPLVSADTEPDAVLPDQALASVNTLSVNAFVIGNDGAVEGDPQTLPAAPDSTLSMFAITRNWSGNAAPDAAPVEDMLVNAKARAAHVKALTDAAVKSQYAGIVVDYRNVSTEQRSAFTRFVNELAASLHKNKKQLVVVLPTPVSVGGEWDTAGYDWQAIGLATDLIQLDAPADPTAYLPKRSAEQLLAWTVRQINRNKLILSVPAASVKQTGNSFQVISTEEALKPFRGITATADLAQIAPGTAITLALGDAPRVELDSAVSAYRYNVTVENGAASTIWIDTGNALEQKLKLASRFSVRGIVANGLIEAGNAPGTWLVLSQYASQAAPSTPKPLSIAWTVRGADGTQLNGGTSALTNTTYLWTAPASPGQYTIAAAIPGSATRGQVTLNVVPPTPTLAPTVAPTPQATATPTRTIAGGVDKCPAAEFVADVTIPDGTQMDKSKEFVKTWKIRNVGSCDWGDGTTAMYIGGEKMGSSDSVKVGAVRSGDAVEITVKMKAPDKDGNFETAWQISSEKGEKFGPKMTAVIVAGQPQQVAAAQPAPPAVSAPPSSANVGGFQLGGHVQGMPVGPMKQAGMTWIKVQIHHGDIPTGIINEAHANGFKLLAGTVGDKGRVMSPAYQDEFAAWTAQLASAGVDAIEVWNEPNIDHEWPVGQINGGSYTALLAKAYAAIKNARSSTIVISAALAPTGYFAGGCQANGCNDDVFLAQMAQAGAARYMDCVGAHHNAGATAPSATSGHPADSGGRHYSWYYLPTLNLYYGAFGGGRKVCFTEFGYLSGEGYPSLQSTAPGFAWAGAVTVGQQAAWLAEAASLAANSGKVSIMIIWNIDFTYYGSDPQAGYAIIRKGGGCPACTSLGQVMGPR